MSFLRRCCRMHEREVSRALSKMPPLFRSNLLKETFRLLQQSDLASDEDIRIGAVQVLLASLPKSLGAIEALLRDFSRPLAYEVHFSLFCFLYPDSIPTNLTPTVLASVESYLRSVPKETAHAAFIAGHVLGDHWETPEAIEILTRCATKARFSAGRKGAIHGLAEAFDELSAKEKRRILPILKRIATHDKSKQVRLVSRMTLRRALRRLPARHGQQRQRGLQRQQPHPRPDPDVHLR